MNPKPLDQAKHIATVGITFRIPAERGLFPPRDVANAFFGCGYDDLPSEDVLEWEPFSLPEDDYAALFVWWQSVHPDASVQRLGLDEAANFPQWFDLALRQRTRPPQRA